MFWSNPFTLTEHDVKKEAVEFGAGPAGSEFLEFAMLNHVGQDFDIHLHQARFHMNSVVFFEWQAEWRSKYALFDSHRTPAWAKLSRG